MPASIEDRSLIDARDLLEHLHHSLETEADIGRDVLRVDEISDFERPHEHFTTMAADVGVGPVAVVVRHDRVVATQPELAMIVAPTLRGPPEVLRLLGCDAIQA